MLRPIKPLTKTGTAATLTNNDNTPEEAELRARKIRGVYKGADFPAPLQEHTFKNAVWSRGTEGIERFYKQLNGWEPHTGERGLLIMGEFGRGKSYLMHAIINAFVEKHVTWFYYFKFGQIIRKLWAYEGWEREQYWTTMCERKRVFIEDLGRAPRSSKGADLTWWVDTFFEFVDQHETLQYPVVYTTNFDESQLRKILGGATTERIFGNCDAIVLKGPNRRVR